MTFRLNSHKYSKSNKKPTNKSIVNKDEILIRQNFTILSVLRWEISPNKQSVRANKWILEMYSFKKKVLGTLPKHGFCPETKQKRIEMRVRGGDGPINGRNKNPTNEMCSEKNHKSRWTFGVPQTDSTTGHRKELRGRSLTLHPL